MAETNKGIYYPSEEEKGQQSADILNQFKLVAESVDDIVAEIDEEIENNDEISRDLQARQTRLEEKYDAQIRELANENPQLPEIVDARGGFDTLGERLDNSDTVKADKTEVQSEATTRQSSDSDLQNQINVEKARNEELLNQKLDSENIYENSENIYLGAFASEFVSRGNYIRFYLTKDLINFAPLTNIPLSIGTDISSSLYVPTSDILYRNNKFYLLSGASAGKGSINYYTSTDLKNWEQSRIDLLPTLAENTENWAPKWFEYENELYITLCIKINGYFRPYIAKVNSLEPFSCDNALPLNLPSSIQNADQIDQKMIFYNNNIYLFQRRYSETYDHIEYYMGNSIDGLSYQGVVSCFENIERCEAPFVIKSDNLFYIYADCSGQGSGIVYATSPDLVNWSVAKPVNSSLAFRHGCVVKIDNEINKKLLLQSTSNNTYSNFVFSANRYIDIKLCIQNGVFTPINVDNITYYVDLNNDLTINQVNTTDIDKINRFNIILWYESNFPDGKLSINFQGGGLVPPQNVGSLSFSAKAYAKKPLTFYNSGRKSFAFDYSLFDKYLRTLEHQLSGANVINCSSLADENGVISNLDLYNGAVYTVGFSPSKPNFTINSFTVKNFINYTPFNVYFLLYSNQHANSLTLKRTNNFLPDSVGDKTFYGDTDGNKFIHFGCPLCSNYCTLMKIS